MLAGVDRRVYEMGDKFGKLLYWLATHGAAARVVPAVRDKEGNTQVELEVIAQAFATHYQDFYARDPLLRLVEEDSLVWDLLVPTITPTISQDLDQPLTAEEIFTCYKSLPKVPNLDSSLAYCKTLSFSGA
ncbi:hypothetical protein NDU88_002720 [Pleurodeles waltl]|uniref:Uncharacterized protein n=1 Tax=Pleurodeles waltl TaxID=8319 RepID=A0AAV7UY25_PLEWA|nr:hypothetical protein NDU88_002720 [Pleurodeles waltl]